MLCHVHAGSPGLDPAQPNSPSATRLERVIANAKSLRSEGRYREAEQLFLQAAELAGSIGLPEKQTLAYVAASGVELHLFHYQAALDSASKAYSLAVAQNNPVAEGAAEINLASVYAQLGDFQLADRKAEDAVTKLDKSPRREYLAMALLLKASVEADDGRAAESQRTYRHGIEVAQAAKLDHLEIQLHDDLGTSLLRAGDLRGADEQLQQAYELEQVSHDDDLLAVTLEHQAELNLKRGNYAAASRLIDQAFHTASLSFRSNPQYYPIHIRAQILEGEGNQTAALAEYRRAVESANRWRRGALPGDRTSTRTVVELHAVYQDFARLAATMSLSRNEPALAREGLEVLATNRAANLRDQMTSALGRSMQLPQAYFEKLSELQAAQVEVTLGSGSSQGEAKVEKIREDLSELENGLAAHVKNPVEDVEKNSDKTSLRGIQGRLSGSQALLSFCLAQGNSFLWAVTSDRVNVYMLPGESEIGRDAAEFSASVEKRGDAGTPGQRLSRSLFGKLPAEVWQRSEWLIVGDGPLLGGVPFSALPDPRNGKSNELLIQSRSLRLLPSELLLRPAHKEEYPPRFLGVGDPIYNLADSRRSQSVRLLHTTNVPISSSLSRLAGSGREVMTAAKLNGMAQTEILVGSQANGKEVRSALAKGPGIIHFAVHVVSPTGKPEQAALALGLKDGRVPELLLPETIATFNVPGSLVVLSGCASEQGEMLPSAGLMGLSRAWLLAGASAVVVSAWPTPDYSDRFFSSFYTHLKAAPGANTGERAAYALQQAQIELGTQKTKNYINSPAFWAAYSIVSKE